MSAKKSWDIAPRPRAAAPAARPTSVPRTMRDMHATPRKPSVERASVPVSTKNVTISRGKKPRAESKEPLKKRRKKNLKALIIVLSVLVVILLAGLVYAAWLPALRVGSVSATGPHADEAKVLALQALQGTHGFVLPRNSLFFIPEEDMRARILNAFPDIEALSVTPDGLNALHITLLPRAEAFSWCGVSPDLGDGTCYSANAEGLVFAPVPIDTASTSEALKIYAALAEHEGTTPIGAQISYASRIPEALRFVKAMQSLGADVVSITLRDDEADLRTVSGTRITYVLGHEQDAANTAASVFSQLSLNDGSIVYVDLRFPGKAYFKRTNTAPAE